MSVIVKTPDGYKLYTKGADNAIMSRQIVFFKYLISKLTVFNLQVFVQRLDASSKNSEMYKKTKCHIKGFASKGLRTLCLATRNLSGDFFNSWKVRTV